MTEQDITIGEFFAVVRETIGDVLDVKPKAAIKKAKPIKGTADMRKITWRIQTVKGGKFALVSKAWRNRRNGWDYSDDDALGPKYYADHGYHSVTEFGAKQFNSREEARQFAIEKKLTLGFLSSQDKS